MEEKENPSILKDDFSARTYPSIFASIVPVLLDRSNKTNWVFRVEINKPLLAPTVSRKSDSKSEANPSCCHWSNAWSHLEYDTYITYNSMYQISHGIQLIGPLNNSINIVGLFQFLKYRSYGLMVYAFSCTKSRDTSVLFIKMDHKVFF